MAHKVNNSNKHIAWIKTLAEEIDRRSDKLYSPINFGSNCEIDEKDVIDKYIYYTNACIYCYKRFCNGTTLRHHLTICKKRK